jgi:hypothetical protein
VKLEDGLLIYQSNTKFWEFTLRLERTAADMLKLLVDDNYQPLDDDKRKAHQLLDEIETWKADCDEEKKGNYAIRNSPSDVWNALRQAMKATKDLDALHAIMTLEGFGKTSKTAKRASAVLRIFKPSDWGVVDWRVAAMLKQLELTDWNVDEALSRPPHDEKPWVTYIEINDWLTLDMNATYRAKRNGRLPRTADVEMAIFSLSFKVPRWNRS